MADFWFAECLPCKWQAKYPSESDAIFAAEDHIAEFHVKVPAKERAEKRIGHVQLRSEDAIGTAAPVFPVDPQPVEQTAGESPALPEGSAVTDPELGL